MLHSSLILINVSSKYSLVHFYRVLPYKITLFYHGVTGIEVPRGGRNGEALPSPRKVSVRLFVSKSGFVSGIHSQLAMIFGEFLDHDITRAPISKLLHSG